MRDLPGAARLAAWGTAALTGGTGLDEASDQVAAGHDATHRVLGLPGEQAAVTLPYALGRLRALGAAGLRLVLPVPGDATGLPGPAAFNEEAILHGEAVVTTGRVQLGLLPGARGSWSVHEVGDAGRGTLPLGDAARDLTRSMREAAELLERLDLTRWEPAAAEVLAGRSRSVRPQLPPSAGPQAQQVLLQALRVAQVVDAARTGEGAALTAAETAARSGVLRDLDTAARRAVEAACSPPPP